MNQNGKSDLMVASIASRLYQNGVSTQTISILDVGEEDEDLFIDAICWMRDEGLIRTSGFASTNDEGITTKAHDCVLSSFGFAAFSNRMERDGKETTLGTEIKRVSETKSSWGAPGEFIGGLLGGFTKSISG